MPVAEAAFKEDIRAHIQQVTQQENEENFEKTLANYVAGLVKHHGDGDSTEYFSRSLKEFLDDSTQPFVEWCAFLRALS